MEFVMKQILCGWLILGQILLSAGLPMNAHAGPKVSEQTICEQMILIRNVAFVAYGSTMVYDAATLGAKLAFPNSRILIDAASKYDSALSTLENQYAEKARLKTELLKKDEYAEYNKKKLIEVEAEISKQELNLKKYYPGKKVELNTKRFSSLSLAALMFTLLFTAGCEQGSTTAECKRPKSSITPKDLDQLMDPKTCMATLKEKPMLYQELQSQYLEAEKQAKKMSKNKNAKPVHSNTNPTGSIDSGSTDAESALVPAEAAASGI
jgi:hypothetical protein